MKLKYYLRGAGIGIIIAVLIMVLGGGGNRTMSDGEIIRRASELGMVKADDGSGTVKDHNEKNQSSSAQPSSAVSSQEAPPEPSGGAEESPGAETASSAAAASVSAASTESTTSTENTPASSVSAESPSSAAPASEDVRSAEAESRASVPAVEDGSRVMITIETGMLSDKVADMLQAAGLIDDAKDFNKYLISKGYDRQIYKGGCVITKGSSYEEIAKVLISKNR